MDAWTSASSQVLSPTVSIHSATVSVHTAATKETRTVSDSPNVSQCLFSVSVHNPFASAKKKGKQIPLTCNRRSVDSGPEFWAALPPVRESGLSSPDICVLGVCVLGLCVSVCLCACRSCVGLVLPGMQVVLPGGMQVRMYACIYLCMCVCLCVCEYMYVYVCVCIYITS